MQLDIVAHGREVGDWSRAQEAAMQLVGWVVTEARQSAGDVNGEPIVEGPPGENARVEQKA
jgi:hypothetical protein